MPATAAAELPVTAPPLATSTRRTVTRTTSARTLRTRPAEQGEIYSGAFMPTFSGGDLFFSADKHSLATPTVVRHTRLQKTTIFLGTLMDARRPTRVMLSPHLLLPPPVVEQRRRPCKESRRRRPDIIYVATYIRGRSTGGLQIDYNLSRGAGGGLPRSFFLQASLNRSDVHSPENPMQL